MTDAAIVMARCDALCDHTEEPGKITRRFGTPALAGAILAVEGWMREAGLETRRDPALNLFGRLRCGVPAAPVFLLGSHVDSVPDGGRYDGPLGVLTALATVERIARAGTTLAFDLEVCAFSDEESVRYGTAYWGSSAVAGRVEEAWLERADAGGEVLRDVLAAAGGDPTALHRCAMHGVAGWLELHIEQGPVLEGEGLPIGVVTGIPAQRRLAWTIEGLAGHAGTTPMSGRRDALAGASELVLAVERIGRSTPGLVATVGVLIPEPGAMNVIAGRVSLTTDVRHLDDATLARADAAIADAAAAIAGARRLAISSSVLSDDPAVPCDARLMAAATRAIRDQGFAVRELPSGAGHDAVPLSHVAPVAMLFLRCAGGISHHPAESVDVADVAIALDVMERIILDLGANR